MDKPQAAASSAGPLSADGFDAPQAGAALLVALLAAAYCLAYFDRMLMIVVGETIKLEFGLSDKQLSLLTGAAFAFMYGTLGILGGYLADRRARLPILAGALALWSAMTMACGLAANYLHLAIARMGIGVGEACILPTGFSLISDAYPPKRRAMPSAVFFFGGMVGVLGAFVIGSWLAERFGWRGAFLIAGPPGLILAVIVLFLGREPARERAQEATANDNRFGLVFSNRPLMWIYGAIAFAAFGNVGMVQWLPMFFIRSHQLSRPEIGQFFGPVLAGGMIAGVLLGGWIGQRLAARSLRALLFGSAVPLFLMVAIYLVLLTTSSTPLALGLTFVAMAAAVTCSPLSAAAWQAICDPRARGTGAGLSGFGNMLIGGAVCPFLVGAASDAMVPRFGDQSLRWALVAGLVFLMVSGLLFVWSGIQVKSAAVGEGRGRSEAR